jgi:hypothetical protein
MGASWKRGTGFRTMDKALVSVLTEAGINPDHVYAAIEAGINQTEIERAVARAIAEGTLKSDAVLPASMRLTINGVSLDITLEGEIRLE